VLDLIEPGIDKATNDKLCGLFSEKETSDALFQIGSFSAWARGGSWRGAWRHARECADEILIPLLALQLSSILLIF
jgi:hypothetical protein